MKTLILIRHAKSSWYSRAPKDFDRPLAERGLRDAPRMGAWLKQWLTDENMSLDAVVSSSAKRALHTAELVAQAVGYPVSQIKTDSELYLASRVSLQEAAENALAPQNCVALVGHNPGLDYLLSHYCPGAPRTANGKLMTTANIAIIEFSSEALTPDSATLRELKRPRELA